MNVLLSLGCQTTCYLLEAVPLKQKTALAILEKKVFTVYNLLKQPYALTYLIENSISQTRDPAPKTWLNYKQIF